MNSRKEFVAVYKSEIKSVIIFPLNQKCNKVHLVKYVYYKLGANIFFVK